MKKVLIITIIIFFLSARIVFAAWGATENFDSYTAGASLSGGAGGSGWTANWSVTPDPVTTENAPSGMSGKSALAGWTSGDGGEASRTFTAITEGTVSFQMMATATNRDGRFTLIDTTVPATRVVIRFTSGGNINAIGSGTNTLQTYNANQVYTIKVKFGHTAGNFAVSIDGGAYSADFDMNGTGSQVNKLALTNENVSASSFYFDEIKDGDVVVETPPTPILDLVKSFWW